MMQTANVFSEDEGRLMVENPMVRRMMGADASDELAKLVLDEFSFKIRAAAESSKEGLSARDIEGLIDDFMQKGRDKTLVNFQQKFEEILREHERDIWDRTRTRPFERVLIQRFCHLFPSEGELDKGNGLISRRLIPGFLKTMEQMVGFEQCERFRRDTKDLITRLKNDDEDHFRWYDIYDNRTANGLVDEALATAALTFDTFEKRITWLLFSVNAQLVTAEYFAFEGETVNSWKLDRLGLIAMLDALYAPLAKQAKKAAGRTEIERRYGMRAAAAIGHLLMRIEAEMKKSA
tara:strand:+ start:450 stop:1325 length:876 start_codon:yes stop_codon:yes gene_type:complete